MVGNVKEALIPYAKKQLKLAKMSFDLFGALSPSEGQPRDLKLPGNGGDERANNGDKKHSERLVTQAEVEGSTPQVGWLGCRRSDLKG